MVVSNETFTWLTLFYLALVVLPVSIVVAFLQSRRRAGGTGWRHSAVSLTIPILAGVLLAGAYYLRWCASDSSCWLNYIRGGDCCEVPRTALSILGAYIIMGAVNHLLAPRIRGWVILVGPILMVLGYLGLAAVLSSIPEFWKALATLFLV